MPTCRHEQFQNDATTFDHNYASATCLPERVLEWVLGVMATEGQVASWVLTVRPLVHPPSL